MVINKHFKYIARIIVWGIIGFHIGLAILLNIPVVQKKMATLVSSELEKVLNTEVSIGHVELGLFNRIHVEDVLLNDLDGEELLKVNRLSARFELTPLFKGKIVINSVQLIGFNAHLKKDTPESIPNFQFVLDAFASKDTLKKSPNLDLRINSVLINHGNLTYDVLSEAETPGIFNSSHVEIQNLSTSIVLKTFQNDSLNATIRRIEFHEKSGFNLKKVGLKVTANNKHLKVKDFIIQLPNSTFKMDSLNVHYDNLHNIFKTVKNTSFSGQMNAALFLPDLSSICPALKNFTSTLNYSANLEGKGKDIILSQISLLDNQNIKLAGSLSISDWDKGQNMYIQANLTHLYLTSTGIQHLMTSLTESVPSIIPQMEYIQTRAQLNGFINDLKFFANIKSNIGQLSSNILMRIDKEGNQTYSGILNGVDFNWGKLLGDKKIGLSNFNITLEGGNYKNQHPETYIKGVVSSIDYNNYRYENIFLDGNYKNGGFSGYLSLDDKNGKIQINGFFNPTQPLPHFNLCASISQLRPHELKISNKHIDSDLSLNLKADFIGRSINDMKGYILLDSLVLNAPLNKRYFLDSLSIIADKYKGENRIQVKSSFMEAIIQGNYSYSTIPTSILQTIQQYIPTLRLSNNRTIIPANNDFKFEFQLKNAELFKNLFYIPIEMHIPSTLKGHIDDPNRKLRIEGSFPQMTYNGTLYESVSFICENPTDYFQCQLRGSILMNSGAMLNLALDAKAEQNYLNTTLNWGNNTNITYGGRIATRTHFFCNEDKSPKIKANVEILPTTIVLNDTVWNIHSSHIDIDSDKIHINKFLFERPGQHLSINGTIAKNPIDTCIINLENIDIQYVLDIVQFDDVEFGGLATGKATLKNLLNSPDLHTHLKVHDFTVNKGIMGEADIEGVWDNNLPGIQLKAKMIEKDISSTKVTGFVSPKLKALDLNIVANKTNLNLLAPYFDGIFSELDGRATGLVRLYGGFKTLDFEGGVSVNLNTKIDVLNTHLHIPNDSVYISPGKFILKNARIFDKEGNSGNGN